MDDYSLEVKKLLKTSELLAINDNNKNINTYYLLLSVLNFDNVVSRYLINNSITYNKVVKNKNCFNVLSNNSYLSYSDIYKKIINNAFKLAGDNNHVNISNIFISLIELKKSEAFNYLKNNIDMNELYSYLKNNNSSQSLDLLNELGNNFNELAKNNEFDIVIGRDKEIDRITEILARKNKNNPILVGEAGVGKTSIVEELARRIVNKNVPNFLENKIIYSVNMSNVISGTKYRGEFEEKLTKLIKEVIDNKNIILFIDEIHTLVNAGGAEGAIDATNILKPFLARGNFRLIGATTFKEYKKSISLDKALDRRFQKVTLYEPNYKETFNILKKIKKDYEAFHNVSISYDKLELLTNLSKKYLYDRYEPDRSIDILDEVCAKTSVILKENNINKFKEELGNVVKEKNKYLRNNKFKEAEKYKKLENEINNKINKELKNKRKVNVTEEIIKEVIESKSGFKLKEFYDNNFYTNLNKKLNSLVYFQEDSINKIIDFYKKYNFKSKPLSILISGNNGVGKSFFAEKFSEIMDMNLIKLDMNDYINYESMNKIIGSPQGYIGYNDMNTVIDNYKNNYNTVFLLDNFSNAHKKVQELFYQIFNSGEITTNNNEKIKFYNNTFILTDSNKEKEIKVGFQIDDNVTENKNVSLEVNFNDFDDVKIEEILVSKNIDKKYFELIKTKLNYKKYGLKKLNEILSDYEIKTVV